MDFSFSEEEELFKNSVREFAEKEIMPIARKMDEEKHIPKEIVKKVADFGILGMTFPEEYGGQNSGFLMGALAIEELARAELSMSLPVLVLVTNSWGYIFSRYGTEEAKEEFLPKVTKGEAIIGIASTEPHGGSDVAGIKTRMEKRGDKWIINGEKSFISGIREAKEIGGGHVTLAKTDPELGHKGISLAIVPMNSPGVETTIYDDMGRNGLSTGGIIFTDVEIPEHYLIGELNKGFYYAMEGFNDARIFVAAACIGAAERVLELGMEWVKERKLFGYPIAKFEGIQFEIVDAWVNLQNAKHLVYRAAWLVDRFYKGEKVDRSEINKYVAAAKYYAPKVSFEIIKNSMMWHGAIAYTKELDLEMAFRGVFSYVVGAEGGLNVMKVIIGRELLGREYMPYK
ncbi:MAG: acyl-CoA dehydrogenase family protein [Candidatus Njordarchaeia archaeon]